jgi:signal recognition particle subunit SRP19
MRKQERIIIWPTYFDSTRSASGGRRVPKNRAVPSPRITEIKEAAERLGLAHELVGEVGYPKTPWLKTGMLLVDKTGSKTQTISTIAKQLQKTRAAAQPKQFG